MGLDVSVFKFMGLLLNCLWFRVFGGFVFMFRITDGPQSVSFRFFFAKVYLIL